jgi:hypothetical protein
VPGERGVPVALTRALFAWSPRDNCWPIPHFEMDASENFATILPVNADQQRSSRPGALE